MQATPPQHRASITAPKRVGDLLRRLDTCEDSFQVAYALRLAPLVFMRPGNMHGAEWQEINVEAADWRIPPRLNEDENAACGTPLDPSTYPVA